jgi:hypothetical protein
MQNRGLAPPDERRFHAWLFDGLLRFQPFEKVVNYKFPYNPRAMLPVVANLFAKLIIDEDWPTITS